MFKVFNYNNELVFTFLPDVHDFFISPRIGFHDVAMFYDSLLLLRLGKYTDTLAGSGFTKQS